MNTGEIIRVEKRYVQPDKSVSKATINVNMATVGVLFQNASIHQTRDEKITVDNVCSLLTAKTYIHIRRTADGGFFGVKIPQAKIAEFCQSFGLREIPKKDGTRQFQLNVGKLPKIGSKSYYKWADYGEVIDLTEWVNKKISKKVTHQSVVQDVRRKKSGYIERYG